MTNFGDRIRCPENRATDRRTREQTGRGSGPEAGADLRYLSAWRGGKGERSPFEFRGAVERFHRSQGLFVLAASAEEANAFEHPMTGDTGILTFTLLAGIGALEDKHSLLAGARVASSRPNGEVDVLDLLKFAEQHEPALYEKLTGQKGFRVEVRGPEPGFPLLRLK